MSVCSGLVTLSPFLLALFHCAHLFPSCPKACGISRHTDEALNRHSLSELGWIPRLSGPVMEMEM